MLMLFARKMQIISNIKMLRKINFLNGILVIILFFRKDVKNAKMILIELLYVNGVKNFAIRVIESKNIILWSSNVIAIIVITKI